MRSETRRWQSSGWIFDPSSRSVAAAREEERTWSEKRLGPKPSCCAINGALDDPRTRPFCPDPRARRCRGAGQSPGNRRSPPKRLPHGGGGTGCGGAVPARRHRLLEPDVRSEEHTSELQSLMRTSYAVFCLQKKKNLS